MVVCAGRDHVSHRAKSCEYRLGALVNLALYTSLYGAGHGGRRCNVLDGPVVWIAGCRGGIFRGQCGVCLVCSYCQPPAAAGANTGGSCHGNSGRIKDLKKCSFFVLGILSLVVFKIESEIGRPSSHDGIK